jgi:hypothetical protein
VLYEAKPGTIASPLVPLFEAVGVKFMAGTVENIARAPGPPASSMTKRRQQPLIMTD